MEWIYISDEENIPKDKNIIVEDEYGCIGQAYFENDKWYLETFGRISIKIEFSKIVRYFILLD